MDNDLAFGEPAYNAAMMNVNLTPEQEKIVNDELKSGRFRSAAEVIGEALQVLLGRREMLAFVEKNRVRLEGVSVKELIHEGHRL